MEPRTVRGVTTRWDSKIVSACKNRISLVLSVSAKAWMVVGSLSTTATTRNPRRWSRWMAASLESTTCRPQPQGFMDSTSRRHRAKP